MTPVNNIPQPIIVDKEKQKEGVVQNEEIFLYKLYTILLETSKSKTPKLVFIQDEINNLEKILNILQSLIEIILFFLLSHYKTIWQNLEKDIQYWKKIVVEFIKQKHNPYTRQ